MNAPAPYCGPPAMPGSYLVVETTNKCSLACVHCSVSEKGHGHHTANGYVDPKLILDLFDDLVASRAHFDTLIFFWLGEPLIHPSFNTLYQAALRANRVHRVFGKLEIHTNATHLSEEKARVALNASPVPQVWHFSLDAARRDTYHRIKGMDRFEKVEANIARFLALKGSTGARWPRVVFQYILSSANAEEAPAFLRRWGRACDAAGLPWTAAAQNVPAHGEEAVVFFRQLDCPSVEEQERENRVFRDTMGRMGLALPRQAQTPEQVDAVGHGTCSGFWKSPVVGWNGELTVCTRDNLLHNSVGNLYRTPFSRLWWGALMQGRRERVARGDYGGLPTCQDCFIPRSSNYTDVAPEDVHALATWERSSHAGLLRGVGP